MCSPRTRNSTGAWPECAISGEVVALHRAILETSGGAAGIRDLGALESALAQPRATFDEVDLHATLAAKAAALAFSLTLNHPFVDGNKRAAHAAMEVFLILNDHELTASMDEQERLMLDLAAGKLTRDQLTGWIEKHCHPAA